MEYEQLLDSAYKNVSVNIDVNCASRFEIPKVRGHHMAGKTVIVNFLLVCSYLRRDPVHVMKFLSRELASQGEIQNEKLMLSRKLSSAAVNEKLEKYACIFVMCPKCKKPDTELVVEGGKDYIRCLACGGRAPVYKL